MLTYQRGGEQGPWSKGDGQGVEGFGTRKRWGEARGERGGGSRGQFRKPEGRAGYVGSRECRSWRTRQSREGKEEGNSNSGARLMGTRVKRGWLGRRNQRGGRYASPY